MPFQLKPSPRRRVFLSLIGDIENGLRDVYTRRYDQKQETQASLAKKLGVNRSVIHRRLTGGCNLTIETLADMVWALDCDVTVRISDRQPTQGVNYFIGQPSPSRAAPPPAPAAASNADESLARMFKGRAASAPLPGS